MSDSAPRPDVDTGLRSSVAALVLGVVLAIGVAKLVSLIGIGGELASQAAGAASGAAPLLIDGMRRRRAITRRLPRVSMNHVRFGRPPLLVASVFGFMILLIDTLIGPYLGLMTRQILIQATGTSEGYLQPMLWATGMVQSPVVIGLTIALAVAAAHRMTHHQGRWLWFGIGLYVGVRIAMVLIGDISLSGAGPGAFVASAVLLGGVLGGVSMIGMVIARRTQAGFTAAAFFNRLSVPDQQAALALLANNDDDPTNDMPIPEMRPRYSGAPTPGERSPSERTGEPTEPPRPSDRGMTTPSGE